MKQLHTVPSLFEALQEVIPNLPAATISLDLHLDSREAFPLMRVETEVWREGSPVIAEGGEIERQARVFRVVEVATVANDLVAKPGAEDEVGEDGPVVWMEHGTSRARISVPQPIADVLLAVFGEAP